MVTKSTITYRKATTADAPLLAAHHRKMFEEMRETDEDNTPRDTCCGPGSTCQGFPLPLADSPARPGPDFDRLEQAMHDKLTQQLADGSCTAWIAFQGRDPVASGALTILSTVPVPEDPNPETGFLHSVFTEKSARRQGIGATILDYLLAHCRGRGIRRVQLNASEAGRGLYGKKGFQALEQVMLCWLDRT